MENKPTATFHQHSEKEYKPELSFLDFIIKYPSSAPQVGPKEFAIRVVNPRINEGHLVYSHIMNPVNNDQWTDQKHNSTLNPLNFIDSVTEAARLQITQL